MFQPQDFAVNVLGKPAPWSSCRIQGALHVKLHDIDGGFCADKSWSFHQTLGSQRVVCGCRRYCPCSVGPYSPLRRTTHYQSGAHIAARLLMAGNYHEVLGFIALNLANVGFNSSALNDTSVEGRGWTILSHPIISWFQSGRGEGTASLVSTGLLDMVRLWSLRRPECKPHRQCIFAIAIYTR